ncbi:GTPase HflX [Halanaerobiaceae bacterium Z-7014]|uniref:GTPase HflX n=1 Tax=Halonatronomonas betaini TaxID=2778430 RepID=A0A931AND0_9FIRM|nr:GTPase HflX [Halonatronomonas betaini]MBF8435907.1 GTPase HflX [Halonatronomonas betaini]
MYKINGGINIKKDHFSTGITEDQVLLVGEKNENIEELKELTLTAGGNIKGYIKYRKDNVNPAHYVGTGKLNQIKNFVLNQNINLIIFDCELTPAQLRNLEEELEIRVIDRTQLILDIFSLHAKTKESKLQVEKAQLEYMLSRLTGKGEEMSRLAGGIGTRGPGESKLETDRRRINKRIHRLKNELEEIKKTRDVQRQDRKDPIIALAGYTNAGKSTLLNQLTEADKLVADQLFATLDSTMRNFELPGGKSAIISDTVGFIRDLPHGLIASFRATLEEINQADIIIHLVDGSSDDIDKKMNTVKNVLADITEEEKEEILVFNKIDLLNAEKEQFLRSCYPDAIFISAKTGKNINDLLEKIQEIVYRDFKTIAGVIGYEDANLIEKLHNNGEVEKEEYIQEGIYIKAYAPKSLAEKINKKIKKPS